MKFRYIFIGILIVGLIGLIIYRVGENKEIETAGVPVGGQTSLIVSAKVLEPQNFAEKLSLSGSLEANEETEIRSEVSGIVENINFKEGSKVSKGQVLIRVNDRELRAQLSKAQTAQNLASENQRRAKLLLEKQAISQEEFDMTEADFQSAKAEFQLTSAQLSKATIRAPFSGVIGLRTISEGTYVTPATPIATLVNTDKLKLTFSIPEKYSSQVKLNDTLKFTTSNSAEEYKATIYAIEPQVDVETRTLKMRAIAENKEGELIPGTFANVFLPLASVENALFVPTESLIPVQNGKKIFIYQNGVAREVLVETGTRTDSSARVLKGLKPGDTVLTSGVMMLKDGAKIQIEMEDRAQNFR